jgi:hypothetical protein
VTEYRTKLLENALLRAELETACGTLRSAGVSEVEVSFGWDSNLPIEEMWKERSVSIDGVAAFVSEAERSGIAQIGKSDIFLESTGFRFTLCHEGDVHVIGSSALVEQFARRWEALGYAPYPVRQRA